MLKNYNNIYFFKLWKNKHKLAREELLLTGIRQMYFLTKDWIPGSSWSSWLCDLVRRCYISTTLSQKSVDNQWMIIRLPQDQYWIVQYRGNDYRNATHLNVSTNRISCIVIILCSSSFLFCNLDYIVLSCTFTNTVAPITQTIFLR